MPALKEPISVYLYSLVQPLPSEVSEKSLIETCEELETMMI